jgi:tRNA_anti-like
MMAQIVFGRRLAGLMTVGLFLTCTGPVHAQVSALEAVQGEVDRGERQIREVRVEFGNRYEKKLAELKAAYQKAADLENALIVRGEEQRVETEPNRPLESRHLVEEPRLLKDAQVELLAKQSEMISQIVQALVPKLIEVKKKLTIDGKLDDAVEVRVVIQRLQEASSPAQRLSNNSVVAAEELFQAYQSSRERADKMYRGPRLILRGKVAGIRSDPKETGAFTLVLFGGAEGALVDCSFSPAEYRVREDRVGQNTYFVVSRITSDPAAPSLRVQRGVVVDIIGKCEGFEGSVHFGGCSLPKR